MVGDAMPVSHASTLRGSCSGLARPPKPYAKPRLQRLRWEAEPAPPWSASQLHRSEPLPWPSRGGCPRRWMSLPRRATARPS